MDAPTRTLIALALVPFAVFGFRFVARSLVEIAYRLSPPGWFRELLARDRAKRGQ